MKIIRTAEAMARALDLPIDPYLQQLLRLRAMQLTHSQGAHLHEVAHLIVVEPPDTLLALETAAGFPIGTNMIDGTRMRDPDFTPSWEWTERHPGGWIEIVFVLSDDGPSTVFIVPDRDDIDPDLLCLVRNYVPLAMTS